MNYKNFIIEALDKLSEKHLRYIYKLIKQLLD